MAGAEYSRRPVRRMFGKPIAGNMGSNLMHLPRVETGLTSKMLTRGPDETALIPGLPDDIGLKCLARISFVCRHAARQVSKGWREALLSEALHQVRVEGGLVEDHICICLGQYRFQGRLHVKYCLINISSGDFCVIPGLPAWSIGYHTRFAGSDCQGAGDHLLVFGGGEFTLNDGNLWRNVSKEGWAFDFVRNTWNRLPRLQFPRIHPVVGITSKGSVVVTGGESVGVVRVVEVLHPGTSKWKRGIDAPEVSWQTAAGAYSLGEKFYVLQNVTGPDGMGHTAYVYDVVENEWQVNQTVADVQPALQVIQAATVWRESVFGVSKSQYQCNPVSEDDGPAGPGDWAVTIVKLNIVARRWEQIALVPMPMEGPPHRLWGQNFLLLPTREKLCVVESPLGDETDAMMTTEGKLRGCLLHVLAVKNDPSGEHFVWDKSAQRLGGNCGRPVGGVVTV